MKVKPITKFLVFYFLVFIAVSMPIAYMQTFLESVGYTVVERGWILSGTALVSIAMQFLAGYLCDKYQTNKKIFQIGLVIMAFFTFFSYQVTNREIFFHLIFISMMSGMFRTVLAIQDAWVLETDETCKNNYGSIRALGSIGWMIGAPIGAWIIEQYGYTMIGVVFVGLSVVNLLCTLWLEDAQKVKPQEPLKLSDLSRLFKSAQYRRIVLIFFFINIISTADMYTTVDKMIALSASESIIGMRWSVQAFVELPLFFAGAFLLNKFGNKKLLLFGIFMYIVRFMGYAVVQTPMGIIGASLLQCVTFPLIMITSKTLINAATPADLRSSGQTVAMALYGGVPLFLTPITVGFLIEATSIDVSLFVIALIGIIPFLLGWKLKEV